MKTESTGQPIEMAIGPPFLHANANAVKQPASTEMIVNEIAKLVKLAPGSRQFLLVTELG